MTEGEAGGRYLTPRWPHEPFFLVAVDEGWSLGPFEPEGWGSAPDGPVVWADGVTHPVVLLVRGQDGDVVHANDGDEREMSYRVVPVSEAPVEWLGRS